MVKIAPILVYGASKPEGVNIGRRLREQRGSRNQRAFAEKVKSPQQTISKYERGDVPESWLFLARLRRLEGIDLNYLLDGE